MTENAYSGSIQEAALRLWQAKFSAKIITELLSIDEGTLETIVPRSLWFYDGWTECSTCHGRGGKSFTFNKAEHDPRRTN